MRSIIAHVSPLERGFELLDGADPEVYVGPDHGIENGHEEHVHDEARNEKGAVQRWNWPHGLIDFDTDYQSVRAPYADTTLSLVTRVKSPRSDCATSMRSNGSR